MYKCIEGRSRGYFGSVPVCKSTICRKLKETNETVAHERYLAHCSHNSTRLSSDTITMEEKLYDPSKIENVCDKHASGT